MGVTVRVSRWCADPFHDRLAGDKGTWLTGQKPELSPFHRVWSKPKPVEIGRRFHTPRKFSLDAALHGVEKRAEREEADDPD